MTGAGSGIGKAVSIALFKEGYAVALCGRRAALLEQTAVEGDPSRSASLVVPTDVTNPESVAALFKATKEAFGRLDLLFNNAGINVPGVPIDDLTIEQWQSVVDVNLTGPFLCTRQAFPLMKAQTPRGGRIINNGSISAYTPRPNSAPYTATKHAITGLTKSTSLDGRQLRHRMRPDRHRQRGNGDDRADGRAGFRRQTARSRPSRSWDVEHVARAVVYMASLPLDANVQFMTVMATKMPFIGRG